MGPRFSGMRILHRGAARYGQAQGRMVETLNEDVLLFVTVSMKSPSQPSFFRRLLGSMARRRPGSLPRAAARSARRAISLCHGLLSERGEVSGARLAREALAAYGSLDESALGFFFYLLIKAFAPDPGEVGRVADAYRQDPSQANLVR